MLYVPREEGQGLVEYALILVLVAIPSLAWFAFAFHLLGTGLLY